MFGCIQVRKFGFRSVKEEINIFSYRCEYCLNGESFLFSRELPPLGKQFVMRLLYVEQAVPKAVVSSWVNSHIGASSLTQANEALTELGVWQETSMPGGLPAWILKNTFRHNLKIVLTGG